MILTNHMEYRHLSKFQPKIIPSFEKPDLSVKAHGISAIVQNSFKNYTSDLTRHHKFTAISSFISCFDLRACAIIVDDFTLRNFLHDECFFSVIKKKKKLVKGKSSKPILRRGLIKKRSFLGQN